eukprot:g5588.t1
MGICGSRPNHRSNSQTLTVSASTKLLERNVPSALQDYIQAIELNPRNVRAYINAASCQVSMGNLTEARHLLHQAESRRPSHDVDMEIEIKKKIREVKKLKKSLTHVKELMSQGYYHEVFRDLEFLTEKLNCFEWVWRLKGVALMETGNAREVETVIEKARENLIHIPSNSSRRCWWFWLLLQKRWWDSEDRVQSVIQAANKLLSKLEIEAFTSFDVSPALTGPIKKQTIWRVLSLEEAQTENEKGLKLFEQEQYEEAINRFTKAIDIIKLTGAPPQFWSEICYRRSSAFLNQRLYLEAIRDACIAFTVNPFHVESYFRVGQLYLDLDLPSGASAIMKRMEDQCTLRTKLETRNMKSLISRATERMMKITSFDAPRFMGLAKDSSLAQVRRMKNKLALKVHPDKVLSLISIKIDWMTETQSSLVKERELNVREELKNQMEHLFRQLTNAAESLLDRKNRSKADDEVKTASQRGFDPRQTASWNGRNHS